MARRLPVGTWASGVAACLVAGCLFRPPDPGRAVPDVPAPHPARPDTPAGPAPGGLSDYHVHPLPASPPDLLPAAGEPDGGDRAIRPASAPPPDPAPVPGPPAPAPAITPVGGARPADTPPPESPLVAALREVVDRHPDEAARLLRHYDEDGRGKLLALLRLTAGEAAGDLDRLPPGELADLLRQLDSVTLRLRRRACLELDRLCFCRRIDSFGQYEPLGEPHRPGPVPAFQAGGGGRVGERVQVYAQVRNLSSQPREGFYETVLVSTLEILDDHRRPVVRMSLPPDTVRSREPRQDYFLNLHFYIPPRMPAGSYTLRVAVKDLTPPAPGAPPAPRVASRSLDFRVVAPGCARRPDEPCPPCR